MSIIVRFDKVAARNAVYREMVSPPLTCVVGSNGNYEDVPLLIDKVQTIKNDYYRYKIGDIEILIEPKNVNIFTKMVSRCAYSIQPTAYKIACEELDVLRKKNNFGLTWYSRIYNASFFGLIGLWREARKYKRQSINI